VTAGADLALAYRRGHDLEGYVTLDVQPDGAASASRSGVGDLDRRTASGRLSPAQRDRLAAAVRGADLLHHPGSGRPIGDDEVPILVTVTVGPDRRDLRVWEGDAAADPAFAAFDAVVRELVDELLAGVGRPPQG
jgi:hypothetical protein